MIFKIDSNIQVSEHMMLMRLKGDTSTFTRPGQFVNITIQNCFLRRPFSVCRYSKDSLTILYDIVGKGTTLMERMVPGDELEMLTGLGNGFDTSASHSATPLLLGGGCGVAPLLGLAEHLLNEGKHPVVALGFNTAKDIVLADEFLKLGISPLISTVDGSEGTRGFVTDALRESGVTITPDSHYFYICGPMPMINAVCRSLPCDGEASLESRMACGFGICMCCSIQFPDGSSARVCKDGPVFKKSTLFPSQS